jgi:hypothetical protein
MTRQEREERDRARSVRFKAEKPAPQPVSQGQMSENRVELRRPIILETPDVVGR